MFNIQPTENQYFYDIIYNNDIITQLEFIVDEKVNISYLKNIVNFMMNNISITLFVNKDSLELIILNESAFNNANTVKIRLSNLENDLNKYSLIAPHDNFDINIYDGVINIDNDILTLTPSQDEMRLTITKQNPIAALFSDVSINKMPDFTIDLFDDSNNTIYRPYYKGYYILSTVPALNNGDITTADYYSYKYGEGNISRTIYVKVTSDVSLNTAPIFKVITEDGTLRYSAQMSGTGTNFTTNFTVDTTWGDQKVLFDVIQTTISSYSYLPAKMSISSNTDSSTDTNLLFNIFSINS